jgi:hypothetical protein
VPPLRLRRVLLHGVGPDQARFDPLDLDFATSDGAASRVLLSLTNTGGKSTLITLLSSLVVPAARAQVGGKNLGDYVLTGDTSHVVCEWEDAATSTRTVTGTVMEWKDGRRQPASKQRSTTNMHRAWYLFRTGPGLPGLDELPFVVDGRRHTFETYLAVVADLLAPHPNVQWVQTRIQQEWTRALEGRTSIDPVLFGYQMRMNDAETGAEQLLATFDSPDNVVRFFVTALNDDREIAGFTSKLGPYAELAAQRPYLETLAAFCAQVGPRLDTIAERAGAVEVASAAVARARTAGGEHAAALANRVVQDRQALTELKAAATNAAREAATARREYGQISDIRLQLQLELARARQADAETAVAETTRRAGAAQLEARAWEAVDSVLDVEKARQDRDSAKIAYETADAGLKPLRDRTAAAAAALAGRLDGLCQEATDAATAADEQREEAEQEREQAHASELTADRRLNDARRKMDDINAKVEEADTSRNQAIKARWLADDEDPQRCLARWQAAVTAADTQATEEDQEATQAEADYDRIGDELDALDRKLVGLRSAAENAQRRLRAFDTDLAGLGDDDAILTLLGGPPRDVPDAVRAAEIAMHEASDADSRAAGHERLAQAAQEELAYLDETGTAATGPDVLAVLKALVEADFGAVTGLEWVERNIINPDSRRRFITDHPDLAGGVVVSDPARFDQAIECLTISGVRTRTPIIITTAAGSRGASDGGNSPQRHIVVPHQSTWDRAWAATARAELDEIVMREGDAGSRARSSAKRLRAAAASCSTFTSRWQEVTREDLARQAQTSTEELTAAQAHRDTLAKDQRQRREAARACRERRDQARRDAESARRKVAAAKQLDALARGAAEAAARRPVVEAARDSAQRDLGAAQAARGTANATITACIETAAQHRSARETWRRERDGLGVEHSAPDPGGNLEVVRAAWTSLRNELSAAEQGMVEAELLNRAQRTLSDLSGRLKRFDHQVIDRATALARSTSASSREALLGAQRRARDTASAAEKERIRAETEHEHAVAAVRAAEPTSADRQNHLDLSNTPQWMPATPAEIPALLERLEQRNVELRERREEAEQAERESQELHDAVAGDIDAFADTIDLWPVEKVPTPRTYTGPKHAARTEMRELLAVHRKAETAERTARDQLRDAVTAVRASATNSRWRDLDAPAAVRVRSLAESDLVAESATLARRVKAMAGSAAGDVATMDTHRTILRNELVSLCKDQRRLLREISSVSRLPNGLGGDLPGSPTIKIRFEDAPEDEAAGQLAKRIDTWAAELATNPKKVSSSEIRARWLAEAVRDTVIDRPRVGAWSIEVLKPRIDGRLTYCPPERIPDEFSGGQVLTLAVLIYCALAGVRSAHRPGGASPPGSLILDNPFGSASQETLLRMQHRLAAHVGLQLVCATGLNDPNVEAAFTGAGSVIIKLRNDGDLRRNLRYLHLRARVVDGIDLVTAITAGRDQAAQQNWVDATRYEIRR